MTQPVTHVVPADYMLAVMDAAYSSFVSEEWSLESIQAHFVREMTRGTLLAWGAGSYGNWRIEVQDGWENARGFREVTGRVTATGDRLHLTSYDELTWGAQFPDCRLPRPGTEGWAIPITPGSYDIRVVQLYDPAQADSEAVFYQAASHFILELRPSQEEAPQTRVPWLDL